MKHTLFMLLALLMMAGCSQTRYVAIREYIPMEYHREVTKHYADYDTVFGNMTSEELDRIIEDAVKRTDRMLGL